MSIDRSLRSQMADAVLAYMRGEVRSRSFEGAIHRKTGDRAAELAGTLLWYFYDDFIDHPICVDKDHWDSLKRWLAFLKTDYGLTVREPASWAYPRLLAAVFLALWLGALVVACLTGRWWLVAVTWAVLGIIWFPVRRLKRRRDATLAEEPELQQLREVAPFLSMEDWRHHERLLSSRGLPHYDPSIHYRPFRRERRSFAQTTGGALLGDTLLLPLLLIAALLAPTVSLGGGGEVCLRTTTVAKPENAEGSQTNTPCAGTDKLRCRAGTG